ncbi:MAG TPA: type II secretion system F family protein, partial [Armatimonadota bacterium]|nr:type II secretion system F family protein [Armatimonadota bacterium]
MPVFRYEAVDAAGNTVRSTITADSRDAVIQRMRELRYHPVDIAVVTSEGGKMASINARFQGVKLKELVVFTRQFSTMIDAGMTIL